MRRFFLDVLRKGMLDRESEMDQMPLPLLEVAENHRMRYDKGLEKPFAESIGYG